MKVKGEGKADGEGRARLMERGEQGWWRGESKAGGEGRARLMERGEQG